MRFSDPSHRPRQRNADQLHHHLIIPAPTATPTEPQATPGNVPAPLACDSGVRHPLRQRRTHPVPLALQPPSPSPPLLSPTSGDARTQHRQQRPPRSFRASFSEDADIDVGAGDGEEGTDDELEDADGRPAFVPGPRYPYPRSSAREVAPRFSHPHNLRTHPSGVNTTRIAAQPVCHSPLLRSPSHSRYLPLHINENTTNPLYRRVFVLFHALDLPRQLRPWHSHQHYDYPYGSPTWTI